MTARPWAVVLSLAAITFVGTADERPVRPLPEPTILIPFDMRESSVPPFTTEAHTICDKDGDMYFHLWNENGPLANVLRLSHEGDEGKLFSPPEEYARKGQVAFTDFSVTPGGRVSMFLGVGPQAYVFQFNRDGTLDKAIPVELSIGLVITNIVAFDTGSTLLSGYYERAAPVELRGKSYLASLDSTGKINIASGSSFPEVKLDQDQLSSGAASTEDGNAYFLTGNDIQVISQTGEKVRQIHFEKPNSEDIPVNVHVSGNWALIDLVSKTPDDSVKHDNQATRVTYRFLLLDTFTQEPIGLHELPPELKGFGEVCFSRKEGMKFMRLDKGKVKFFKAAL